MNEALVSMIEALTLEIAAIRQKGGGTKISLRGGERAGQIEGSWLYKFYVLEELNLNDETPVRITAGREDVPGVLVSFRDGVLVVALEKDIGPRIAVAELVANDSFLLERLKECLEKIQGGEAQFIRNSADRVLGLSPILSSDAEPHPDVFGDRKVNEQQKQAVRRSLGSETTFIWGPPGTGKTHTLARIVEAHYRAGRSVLLVSNTNIAVDTALEKVAERLKGESEFHQGLVIRQGPVLKPELRQRFEKQVNLEKIISRLGEGLQREKDNLCRQAEPLEAEVRSLIELLKDFERLASAKKALADCENALEDLELVVATRNWEAEKHRNHAEKSRSDLRRVRAMGAVRRLFSGLDPERLTRDAAAADRAAQAATEAARALTTDQMKLEAEILDLREKLKQFVAVTQRHPPEEQIKGCIEELYARLSQIHEKKVSIERELTELEQQVLANCRILATTVYRTYLNKGKQRLFDIVVIDEASMLMPPLIYYVAGLAKQSVTVSGDFRQLPPIVISDEKLTKEWLKCDVFEKADIPKRLERVEDIPHLVKLDTQYRMCEPICNVINKLFYDDSPLKSGPDVNREKLSLPLFKARLLYVDTARFHPWAALRVGTYSRYNLFHALLVRNIILHLAETSILPMEGEPNDVVGAVSPYKSQASLIKTLLDDRLGNRAAGIAATVHRFQGNEKKVMVLDLTDSVGVRLGRFLQATRKEEDGARLLNVAVSRAQLHFILLGNFEYIKAKAPRGGFVRQLVDHFETNGKILDVAALLPLAERDWIDGLTRIIPTTFNFPEGASGAFTEGTFYPAFYKDLTRAAKSIVIFSPFITKSGTARWIDSLRNALIQGAKIRILTRPPEEFGGGSFDEVREIIQALRDLGIIIELRSRMHEKIAILDGHILWHGSLNILSHRDTHESMLRLEGKSTCQQLTRFVTLSKGLNREDDTPSPDVPENPPCPKCEGPTVWKDGRYGIYFKCENADCEGKVNPGKGRSQRRDGQSHGRRDKRARGQKMKDAKTVSGQPCPKPGCNGQLIERSGRFGNFLGCTNYPICRYTKNLG